MKITYLSHSGFLLDDGDHKLVIDPFLSGNPIAPFQTDDIRASYVIITHGHGDHLGDGLRIAKRNNSQVIAVNELANFAAANGASAHNMHIGGGHDFPFGRIKFTIAHHGSSGPNGEYLGEPSGVVIKMGGKTIYHCGDTGLFLDMKLIGELDKIDVMMVPIGDNFTMGIDDAVKAVEFVKPGLAIPMHYNTFPVIKANPEVFREKLQNKGMECKVMEYGQTLDL